MKEIKAFIRPGKLFQVYDALGKAGFHGITITECEGTGRYSDPEKGFPSLKFPFLHSKMVKLELLVSDENFEQAFKIIQDHAHTGETGDGVIAAYEVFRILRIRTGEEGPVVVH